jgi:hypothetical protein
MRMHKRDRIRMKPLEFSQPIKTAIDHYPRHTIRHQQRTVHAMPARSGLDLASGAKKYKFHGSIRIIARLTGAAAGSTTY